MTLLAGAVWAIVDGPTGTIGDAAWVAAVKASIEANIHSATNPTIDPNDLVDEVVVARGGQASLDARLDAMDVLIAAANPTIPQLAVSLGRTNLVVDETFLFWPAGDTAAPTMWTLAGPGGTIQRCGNGLADTNTKIGAFCARIRRVASDVTLSQEIVDVPSFARFPAVFQSKAVGYGAWVRSTAITGARLYISDGVGTTYSISNAAAGIWEWLSVARTLDAGATRLIIGAVSNTDGADFYLSGPTVLLGDVAIVPPAWLPSPVVYQTLNFVISGNAAVVAPKFVWSPHRPGIVDQVMLIAGTGPTGADLIIDVNTWDGAAYTSMFTPATRPRIAAGQVNGANGPSSGTYARRCFSHAWYQDAINGRRLSIDVDQVGSGVAGADVTISVRILVPARPLEAVMDAAPMGT